MASARLRLPKANTLVWLNGGDPEPSLTVLGPTPRHLVSRQCA